MIFEKVKDIIIEQLQVDESEVTMDTNLMKRLIGGFAGRCRDHHGYRRRILHRDT